MHHLSLNLSHSPYECNLRLPRYFHTLCMHLKFHYHHTHVVSDQIKIRKSFSRLKLLNFQKYTLICHTLNVKIILGKKIRCNLPTNIGASTVCLACLQTVGNVEIRNQGVSTATAVSIPLGTDTHTPGEVGEHPLIEVCLLRWSVTLNL